MNDNSQSVVSYYLSSKAPGPAKVAANFLVSLRLIIVKHLSSRGVTRKPWHMSSEHKSTMMEEQNTSIPLGEWFHQHPRKR